MCVLCLAGGAAEAWWSADPACRPRGPQPVTDADRQARGRQHGEERADGSHLCAAHQQGQTVVKVM